MFGGFYFFKKNRQYLSEPLRVQYRVSSSRLKKGMFSIDSPYLLKTNSSDNSHHHTANFILVFTMHSLMKFDLFFPSNNSFKVLSTFFLSLYFFTCCIMFKYHSVKVCVH